MAKIFGYGGNFAGPSGFNADWESWTATININVIDVSAFSSSGWTDNVPGCAGLTGSATGIAQYNASGTAPFVSGNFLDSLSGVFTLTEVSGCTITFSGFVNSLAFGRVNCQKAEVTLGFVSQGAVTRTWDETA
jgi:hypothetical protein